MKPSFKRACLRLRIYFRSKFKPRKVDNISLKFKNVVLNCIKHEDSFFTHSMNGNMYVINKKLVITVLIIPNSSIYIHNGSNTEVYTLLEKHYLEVVEKWNIQLELQNLRMKEKIFLGYNKRIKTFLNKL